MKRAILTAFILSASILSSTVEAGLISHWKFDASSGTSAADESGAYPGTLHGNATWMPAAGIVGGAISVTIAGNGYVNMGTSFPTLNNSDYTLIGWLRTSDTNSFAFAGKHWTGFFNGYFLGGGTGAGYGSPNKAYCYNGGAPSQSPISTTTVNNDAWHQVVGVRRFGTAYIYVDGFLEDTRGANVSTPAVAAFIVGGLAIGGNPASTYNGLIDEVQVYDHAMAPETVQYFFQNPSHDMATNVSVDGTVNLSNLDGSPAGKSASIHIIDSYNQILHTPDATLNANGNYSFQTKFRGPYTVSVKVSHWLRTNIPGVFITNSGASNISFTLTNGDCDEDNEINLVDFGIISSAFGSVDGDPNWDVRADLNEDGEVNLFDFGIVSGNFGQSGSD